MVFYRPMVTVSCMGPNQLYEVCGMSCMEANQYEVNYCEFIFSIEMLALIRAKL